MSKRTRGGTREANRRRENHARKTTCKPGRLCRHRKRALWACILASVPTVIAKTFAPSRFSMLLHRDMDFVPGKGMVLTLPGRIEDYIKINFDIGPGAELTDERRRFLSVLEARP